MKNRTISFFFGLAEARLKQDGQDAQDEQEDSTSPPDGRAQPKTRLQVREDLNVYRTAAGIRCKGPKGP